MAAATARTRKVVKASDTVKEEPEPIEIDDVEEPEPEAESYPDEEPDDFSEEEIEPDDDEPIYEGGPDYGQLKRWKAEYGENSIFVSLINPSSDEYCIWRTLNRQEYRDLVKNLEQAIAQGGLSESDATMNNEESITELCVLHPPYNRHNRKGTNAGFPKMISNDVMEQSGFVQVEVRKL